MNSESSSSCYLLLYQLQNGKYWFIESGINEIVRKTGAIFMGNIQSLFRGDAPMVFCGIKLQAGKGFRCLILDRALRSAWETKGRQHVIPTVTLQRKVCANTFTSTLFDFMFQLNLLAPELFFLVLAHSVYKMWIIQEPNKLELWNKLHFKEKKTESIHHV